MAEVIVATGLLGLLLVVLGWVYVLGNSAWRKADALVELSQSLQVTVAHLARDLEQSAYAGLTLEPATVSCLVAGNDRRELKFDAQGKAEWQRFLVYYRDVPRQLLLRTQVELPAVAPQRLTPGPLTGLVPVHPLQHYATGGSVIGRAITRFEASQQERLVQVTVEAERPGPRRDPERVTQLLTVRLRN